MKVDLSDDSVGVEASKHDVEVARHLKATAESVRDLATTFAGENRGTCQHCGKTRPTRPLALQNEQGAPVLAPVCAKCQRELANQRIEQARRAQAEAVEADDGS